MLKRISVLTLTFILLSQLFAGFAMAAENNNNYAIQTKIIKDIYLNPRGWNTPWTQVSSLLNSYEETRLGTKSKDPIVSVYAVVKDYTLDKKDDIAIVSYGKSGKQYIDVYTLAGRTAVLRFSGVGDVVKLNDKSFSLTNYGYDGRHYYATHTYEWLRGKFVKTGYSITYYKNGSSNTKPTNPGKYDERIVTAKALLSARMKGDFELASKYLSSSYKEKIGTSGLKNIIPYGVVTAVEIFDSQRGDWVAVVMKDWSGRSRVFKFVPVEEKDQYGNIKINEIVEIPQAK